MKEIPVIGFLFDKVKTSRVFFIVVVIGLFLGGGGKIGWNQRGGTASPPLVCVFFPSIRSAKIYVFVGSNLLASCFCKFGPVKNCYQKNNSGFKQ